MAGKKINLTDQLKNYFGFDTFKGNQEAIIQNLLAGNDTFVLMPTGGGKSLCYQLPSLLMDGTAIVISPLIALMKNQVDAMRNFSEEDGIAHFINSSLNKSAIDQVKSDILAGRTKLLYVAPESLTKEENVEFLKTVKISFYAVDEAHCISEWGHDFRPEYRRIRPIINEIGKAPLIALTATATPKVQHDIQKNLGMVEAQVFKSSFNRPNLYYEVRPKTANVDKDIIKFIKNNPEKSGIIYCLSRKKVEELAEILQANGINARAYHAGMDSATRTQNQDDFLMEKIDVIVATIAFGMGIDKPDVRYVIHYDIPKSLEGYYQETGRAGRDGGEGQCITFYTNKDLQKLEKFMQGKPVAEQEIGKQLLLETAAYAESSVCRRKTLLHYFGEEYTEENCGNCDNCLNPKKQVEAQELLCTVIETVLAVKENFKADYIIDILRRTQAIAALMFQFCGMSFADLAHLEKSSLDRNVLHYNRVKTKTPMSVEILDTAKDMIYQLQNRKPALQDCPDYLFSILNGNKKRKDESAYREYQSALRNFNNHLRGLAKALHLTSPVTSYTIRHSWATTAKYRGVPIEMISESLGHKSIKTTQIYLKGFALKERTEVNRMNLSYVKNCLEKSVNNIKY